MKPVFLVTDEHREAYARDGAVRIPSAFRAWIEPLGDAVRQVIGHHRAGTLPEPSPGFGWLNEPSVVEPFGGGAMALNIVPFHPAFGRWLDASPAAEMVAAIMGSRTARFWVDASFWKEEGGAAQGTPWHNDTCTWPFWGAQMTILWIALTDIGDDDGPLTTVAGSHHGDGRYYSPFFPPTGTLPPPYKPWSELVAMTEDADARIQAWTMAAGDCLLMHPSTVHGSRPRRATTGAPRLSFSTRWLGDDVVFRPDALTGPMTVKLNAHPDMVHGAPPPASALPLSWPRRTSRPS